MNNLKMTQIQYESVLCFLVDFYIDIKSKNKKEYYLSELKPLDTLINKLNAQEHDSEHIISIEDFLLISKYLTKFYNECTLNNSIHLYTQAQMKEFNKLVKLFSL